MDHSWINAICTTQEYQNGVEEFLEYVRKNVANNNGRLYCPCVNCLNEKQLEVEEIREHLICDGFCKSYTRWIWHGVLLGIPIVSQKEEADEDMDDQIEDMLRDIRQESFQQARAYDSLCNDAEIPLYLGCTKFTRLEASLKLMNLKAKNGWTHTSFTALLVLLKDMLPIGNTFPPCTAVRDYKEKKVLCLMGLEYKKIHACRNDCILYWKEFECLHQCLVCHVSRYKVKDGGSNYDVSTKRPPIKLLWFLPIISSFKRLFANTNDAMNIRWPADERQCDGKIHHLADSLQWKRIDQLFLEFGNEPRNLRLGLATNGMNPYGNLSSKHSLWPVLLVIYNLPPQLCMKCKYIMLSMMILGPLQPGNDIDVFLRPLIEGLTVLWEEGMEMFDRNCHEFFKMRAMIFCTINDFPAYRNLCGYSVKGHKACPICEEGTCYH